jgi:hypothetical protein
LQEQHAAVTAAKEELGAEVEQLQSTLQVRDERCYESLFLVGVRLNISALCTLFSLLTLLIAV